MIWWILIAAFVGFLAYVRLAPSDPSRWHKPSTATGMGETRGPGSHLWRQRVAGDEEEALRKIDAVAQATARTQVLAGSVADKQITYVTRSKLVGFPDYTTVGVYGPTEERYIEIYGRLRFGTSDLGVNRARVEAWRAVLQ
ncbi:MAG: DUF1499 domain-containing protein [Pseudomonadota bacterium]